MSFYVSTANFLLLHCDEWDRVVALPRHKFVTGATLLQLALSMRKYFQNWLNQLDIYRVNYTCAFCVIRQTNIAERALKIIKSKTESLEKDKSKETIHHIYNLEKEIKSTTTVDICSNQEDYDPTLVLIANKIYN